MYLTTSVLGTLEQRLKGFHVRVWRGLYWHHGVCYLGIDGKWKVIHYVGREGKASARVCVTDEASFVRHSKLVQAVHHAGPIFTSEQILRRAWGTIGERAWNAVYNNCESHATWCCTGKRESGQVNGLTAATIAGVILRLLLVA
jgi:hypothetical protein